jgi:3-deoxy-D-arabino-heptulosonate 7-phosphate (DAHP) synthase
MQLFKNGTEGTITAELTALAGIGSTNRYLILELKQGPATRQWGQGTEGGSLVITDGVQTQGPDTLHWGQSKH